VVKREKAYVSCLSVRENITAQRLLVVNQRADANTHEQGLCARRTNRLHDMNQWNMRPAHVIIFLVCALASALCGECSGRSYVNPVRYSLSAQHTANGA